MRSLLFRVMVVAVLLGTGCSDDKAENLALTAQAALTTSLDGVQYEVRCVTTDDQGNTTTDQFVEYVPFHMGDAPAWLVAEGVSDDHSFADLFTSVSAPSECSATATGGYWDAAQALFTAEEDCSPATESFSVQEGETTEVVMVLQCTGEVNGAADMVSIVNVAPEIEIVDLDKFVCVNDDRAIDAVVTDPENDAVVCVWSAAGPGAGVFDPAATSSADGHSTSFSADVVGEYTVTVSCTDALGGEVGFVFPMHVMDCRNDADEKLIPANVTIDGPSDQCDVDPILAVPISGYDQIAVFDISVLPPVEPPMTALFSTCNDPSRIMVDGAGDILVTCRQDGKAQKHKKDGTLVWSTQLPNCNGARGVVVSPLGRLFASCHIGDPAIYELDPVDGHIIAQTETLVGGVYGLAVDSTGVYACHFWNHNLVSKLNFDLTNAWTVEQSCYGIAADGADGLWVGDYWGWNAVRLNTTSGASETSLHLDGAIEGVIVSPKDGTVHLGMEESNRVVVLAPTTPPTILKDYNFSTWNAETGEMQIGPRGTTVDANGVIYSLNKGSANLTRIDMSDDSHLLFAEGFFPADSVPYGYSSDWTGVFKCLSGPVVTWESGAVTLGSNVSLTELVWDAQTPAGTNIELYYSLDNGGWKFLGNTSDASGNSVVFTPSEPGETIRIRAVLTSTDYPAVAPTLRSVTVRFLHNP